MNTDTTTENTVRAGFAVPAEIAPRPTFAIYHPKGNSRGGAVKFSVEPATVDRDGCCRMTIANQATGADWTTGACATFDWANAATLRLSAIEVAEICMVFGGQTSVLMHAGKEGFFHNTPADTKSLTMKRADDPTRPGFLLGVGRTPKADPNARTYYGIVILPQEAFALRAALLAKMGEIAFGL